jgi:hypothetical protein
MIDRIFRLDSVGLSAERVTDNQMGGHRANGPAPDTEVDLHASH